MILATYDLDIKPGFLSFEFHSEGPKGRIRKFIQFEKIIAPNSPDNIYNLAFGDKIADRRDDLVVSDNQDLEKVLTTVTNSVILFSDRHSNALVLPRGSTPSRTRLYTMIISKNLHSIT